MHSYSTDHKRWKIYIYLGVIALALSLGSGWVAQTYLNPYGFAFGALSLGITSYLAYRGFTKYAWNWGISRRISLTKVPDFNGRWEGHLYTSYDGAEPSDTAEIEHEGLTPMEATVTITQTWDEICVFFDGPDSKSESVSAMILAGGQWPTLTYNYQNSGDPHHDEKNRHDGTTILDFDKEEDSLSGTYYTGPNRENTGRFELKRVDE